MRRTRHFSARRFAGKRFLLSFADGQLHRGQMAPVQKSFPFMQRKQGQHLIWGLQWDPEAGEKKNQFLSAFCWETHHFFLRGTFTCAVTPWNEGYNTFPTPPWVKTKLPGGGTPDILEGQGATATPFDIWQGGCGQTARIAGPLRMVNCTVARWHQCKKAFLLCKESRGNI